MPLVLDLNTDEVARAIEQFGARNVKNAMRSAVKRTSTWAEKETDKRMALATELPLPIFKRHRVFKSLPRDAQGIETGVIWLGYRRVAAKFAGRIVEEPGYLTAGAYHFPHGFMWRGKVFYRRDAPQKVRMTKGRNIGKLRERIFKAYVAMPQAPDVIRQVSEEAGPMLQRLFLERLALTNPSAD